MEFSVLLSASFSDEIIYWPDVVTQLSSSQAWKWLPYTMYVWLRPLNISTRPASFSTLPFVHSKKTPRSRITNNVSPLLRNAEMSVSANSDSHPAVTFHVMSAAYNSHYHTYSTRSLVMDNHSFLIIILLLFYITEAFSAFLLFVCQNITFDTK